MKIRSKSPQTFNKKILYKMAHDRRQILTLVADKIAVRDYVTEKIGGEFLTKVYKVYEKNSEVLIDYLPKNFVLKPNHASGAALIVADFVPKTKELNYVSKHVLRKYYVNHDNLEQTQVTKLVKFWLNSSYYSYHRLGYPEWAYKDIERKVYAEELLSNNEEPPQDFRFLIFNGRCSVIMVDTPDYGQVKRDIYNREWKKLDVAFGWANSGGIYEKPNNLNTMIEIAEALGQDFDHVRVDLYKLADRIVFGEITNYHAGGTQRFNPSRFDNIIGAEWLPDSLY
jgi:hypothetical protein